MTGATTGAGLAAPPRPARPARKRRSPVRHALVVTHRWTSLVLGVLLVLITTSGVVVLYQPELHRAFNASAFTTSTSADAAHHARVPLSAAIDTVQRSHPNFATAAVYDNGDVYTVYDESYTDAWTVDPATGAVLGHVNPDPAWLDFAVNLHECLLTCEGHAGYIAALTTPLPHTNLGGWLGHDRDLTIGNLLLGAMGLLLLFLCVSGVWLWFPRPKRWKQGFTIRWDRGRFARDTDLHKVIGVLALAPLLVWGLTGSGYELGFVEKAWFALTPGSEVEGPEPVHLAATVTPPALPVSEEAAVALALAAHPGTRVAALVPPTQETPTTTVWLSTPHDPYARLPYPGDVGVEIDPSTGTAQTTYGFAGQPLTPTWQAWNFPVHTGYVVNGWWRLLWVAFGLTPLALAITGTSTWLVRRKTAKNRRAAQRARVPLGS
ncbi:Uncharacterized iron-regulated membrane protein [Quadrisphaera granulorum]|uniref:Putative iron-regulated membrane protein n=1 Tax=Quadrisphaera granulorum TaxID=317664 RepID=A0A316A8D6_9ACTN|nr:PepSY-associated TM helix domain-containing protein [Quadrisphaera granulorum]PWJ53762.1 putative iron-regulated membrane protein [Quadrisphaera granulorum]SZE96519.1 Uncharacterized iron-regulated membrane protein [Quadrisphaera granulorum]